MFALFRDGEQISKPHSTWWAAAIEAYERGAVARDCTAVCPYLCRGYSIQRAGMSVDRTPEEGKDNG